MNKKQQKYLSDANDDLVWLDENLESIVDILGELIGDAQTGVVSARKLVILKTCTEECVRRADGAHANVARVLEDIETERIVNDHGAE